MRSRAKLDYAGVQRQLDEGAADGSAAAAGRGGGLGSRQQQEAGRGDISLPIPEQEIDVEGDRWNLEFRPELSPGQAMERADLAADRVRGGVPHGPGRRRRAAHPPPRPTRATSSVCAGRRGPCTSTGRATWTTPTSRPGPRASPPTPRWVVSCTRLLRGSGYVAFNGEVPAQPAHSALASEYAHVTAPLRRLVDRYAGEICVALCADDEVPGVGAGPARRAARQHAADSGRTRRRAVRRRRASTSSRPRCSRAAWGSGSRASSSRSAEKDPTTRHADAWPTRPSRRRWSASNGDRCRSATRSPPPSPRPTSGRAP